MDATNKLKNSQMAAIISSHLKNKSSFLFIYC